jgi:quercetin dioxygenase-like cupin family protein
MREPTVVRLEDVAIVKFGPDAHYQPILGDEAGTTPIRQGIQTSQPGYVAPMHSHPYLEVLHVLDGVAEAWIEGAEDRPVRLGKGDTIALHPNVPHSFRVVGDQALRTLGTHVSPRRIVDYTDGGATDVQGYRVWKG